MSNNIIWVKIAVRNLGIRKKFEEIIASTEGYQVQSSGEKQRPDLLIFEIGKNIEKEFRVIESLVNSDSVGEVFLTSENTDQSVLLKAMRIGVKEFFSQPLNEQEVRRSLDRFKTRREKFGHQENVKSGQIIDVIGSKGGVGATTIAVNLAVSIAETKNAQSVALVDMNMLFGDIPIFLALKPNYHWGEITKDIARLDDTFLMNILSKHSSGVQVLPSPNHLNGNQPVTPETIEHLLSLMKGMFDFVVIDSGQSLNKTSLKIIEMSDKVLLVSLLSLPYLANTNKLLTSFANFQHLPKESIKIVMNRYLKESQVSLKDAEDAINRKVFWTIPNDYKTTMSAINQGKALPQFAAKSAVTKNLKELAAILALKEQKGKKRRWKFLKGW
ncbi:MAG: AAA family ATPase [Desulfobacteraceae bacterium]|nr:MAG: AAA family ATPase [Desulfobacteraceae bacterium]